MNKTNISIVVVGVILVGLGVYFFMKGSSDVVIPVEQVVDTSGTQNQNETKAQPVVDTTKTVLGTSVEKRNITAYHYGTGDKEVLFVGGIHGGYEWNTSLVAYELMDYLTANPNTIPQGLKVTVIPVLNPDGLMKVTGKTDRFTKSDVSTSDDVVISGRFNGNGVDLNRNFDCDWNAEGVWLDKKVSGGTKAFSEPESQAVKNYVESKKPIAAIVWYSSAGGVFASSCHNGISSGTRALTEVYATASKYKAYDSFDFYETTGDMVNWLAKNNIPAISVLLTTHQDTEWTKNLAGIKAVLAHYAK